MLQYIIKQLLEMNQARNKALQQEIDKNYSEFLDIQAMCPHKNIEHHYETYAVYDECKDCGMIL